MFQAELYISYFQNIFAQIPYAYLQFPCFSPTLLASGNIKRQSPHIQVEENPEEIPFLISVVQQQFRESFCLFCQLSEFDVPFSIKQLVSRKWKGSFQVTQQLEVLMAPLARSSFSCSVWFPRAAFDTLQRMLQPVDNKYNQ